MRTRVDETKTILSPEEALSLFTIGQRVDIQPTKPDGYLVLDPHEKSRGSVKVTIDVCSAAGDATYTFNCCFIKGVSSRVKYNYLVKVVGGKVVKKIGGRNNTSARGSRASRTSKRKYIDDYADVNFEDDIGNGTSNDNVDNNVDNIEEPNKKKISKNDHVASKKHTYVEPNNGAAHDPVIHPKLRGKSFIQTYRDQIYNDVRKEVLAEDVINPFVDQLVDKLVEEVKAEILVRVHNNLGLEK